MITASDLSSAKLRLSLRKVTAEEEREFEKESILSQRSRYLVTDVMHKVSVDRGYAGKVKLIGSALGGPKGWVLHIEANTCGEAEYLTTRGYAIIATDINEIALCYLRNVHKAQ